MSDKDKAKRDDTRNQLNHVQAALREQMSVINRTLMHETFDITPLIRGRRVYKGVVYEYLDKPDGLITAAVFVAC